METNFVVLHMFICNFTNYIKILQLLKFYDFLKKNFFFLNIAEN